MSLNSTVRGFVVATAIILTGLCTSCRDIQDRDLVGRFEFEHGSVRIELQLHSDHSYVETIAQNGTNIASNSTWEYHERPPHLTLKDFSGPVVSLGSETVHLDQSLFVLSVEPCGKTICLIASDDDPVLRFVKN
jgi:hypothetical protein